MADLTVVLGDVVDSQAIDDREAFQDDLRDALAAASEADEVVAPFVLQKGVDEFVGVLASPAGLYDALRTVREALRPRRARFAAVHGAVDVGAAAGDARTMDGPAFHRADELIREAERLGVAVRLAVDGSPLEQALEDETNLLLDRRAGWTARQAELVGAYERAESQRAVADDLGLAASTVSEALSAANAAQTLRYERRLADGLDRLSERVG
jgi:hypothetical protein